MENKLLDHGIETWAYCVYSSFVHQVIHLTFLWSRNIQ